MLASHDGTGAGQLLLEAAVGGNGAYLWIAEDRGDGVGITGSALRG